MWASLPQGRNTHLRWAKGCGSELIALFLLECRRLVAVERGWRGSFSLGGIEVYHLWIWLGRRGSTAGDIYMDS